MVNNSSSTSSEADPTEVEPESTSSRSQQLHQPPPGATDSNTNANNKDEEEGQPPPLRSMSSFRARLRAGRREAAAPATLFQWETRGHFWSELDKAAVPKDPSQLRTGLSSMLVRAWQRTKVRAKNTVTVVYQRPMVLVWPLLLCVVCMAGGIIGVELGAKHFEERIKDDARAASNEAVNSLDLVWVKSLQPLTSLELHVALTPRMAALGLRFLNITEQLLQEGPPVLAAVLLSPFAVVRAAAGGPRSAGAGPGALIDQALPSLQPPVSPAIFQRLMLEPYSGPSAPPPTLLVSKPVLISGVAREEDWGNGPSPDGKSIANCSAPACFYQPAEGGGSGGTRLWGFVSGLVDMKALAAQPDAGLKRLRELGYAYRLTFLGDGSSSSPLLLVNSDSPLPSGLSTMLVQSAVPGTNQLLVLEVCPATGSGWKPEWRSPLLAVAVILPVAVSVMLFAALVLQRRHVMFLEAMLPKQVIGVLGTGRTFYQHYDMVTVLYADIVRYSNAPTGMPAWEIVKLLNDVHNIYDNLLDKHGLVKIRRSGEAFMAVGGCPVIGDPVGLAVRVAMCAREMVMATAGFRSSVGQRVQIRLGLHSGPAVAAVLGTHTPRFSLLGDTVDIAHFMESTSTIMGVHVSDTTAELLTIADDPLISLQPRGIIDIKGRGPITTSWLRIDLLAPMGTWNGDHAGGMSAGGAAGASSTNKGSGGGAAGRASQNGGKAAAAAPADIACTADLAVAATLGVSGAPLVRKLSQTGLTQTRRALPDRRQRQGSGGDAYNNSLLGSFTMRLEPETISMVRDMLARSTPPPSPSRTRRRDGSSGGGGIGSAAAFEIAAAPTPVQPATAVVEGLGLSWDAAMPPPERRCPDGGLGAEDGALDKRNVCREGVGPQLPSGVPERDKAGSATGGDPLAESGRGREEEEAAGFLHMGVERGARGVARAGVATAANLEVQMG